MHIFHITEKNAWQAAKKNPEYLGDTFSTDGFIHCCLLEQVEGVLKNWFDGKDNLILLEIDTEILLAPIKNENLEGGVELFPHIYGPINIDAVIAEKSI
ncbi:MAG: DUF952 domain-containing protein [Pelolinea sp.]|nr:DUF952 domain-containing protein [Pelolinea sp.]